VLRVICGKKCHWDTVQIILHICSYVYVIVWQEVVMTTGVMQIDDCLLEGHLGITKELVAMQSVQKRFYIGAENGGCGLIKVCVPNLWLFRGHS